MKNHYWQDADQLTMSKPVIKVELEIRVIEFQVQHPNPLQVPNHAAKLPPVALALQKQCSQFWGDKKNVKELKHRNMRCNL